MEIALFYHIYPTTMAWESHGITTKKDSFRIKVKALLMKAFKVKITDVVDLTP